MYICKKKKIKITIFGSLHCVCSAVDSFHSLPPYTDGKKIPTGTTQYALSTPETQFLDSYILVHL